MMNVFNLDSIPEKKVYSFDLFDTLVCRAVKNPSMVFLLLENHCEIDYKNIIYKWIGFRKIRILSERLARKASNEEDITLDEIYIQLSKFIKNVDFIKEKEIQLEIKLLYPIEKNVAIIKSLIDSNHICCITSDMYLPLNTIKDIISEIVKLNNVKVFLSSVEKKTKHTGGLFEVVKNFYNCTYEDICHIGDNAHADFSIPKKLGIYPIKIKNFNKKYNGNNSFLALQSTNQENKNILYDLGFYISGPCAWVSALWIHNDLLRKNINKIFFGARDGLLFDTAFRKISSIKSVYFRISRSAVFLPFFAKKIDDFDLLFEGGSSLTADDFFHRLGYVCPKYLSNLVPHENKKLFINELKNKNFHAKCFASLEEFHHYLSIIQFSGKLAFFDLGWRGSLQKALQEIMEDDVEIEGYYFGLTEKKKDTSKYNAFFFYENTNLWKKNSISQALAFFEFIFTEPVQSLKNIEVVNDNIKYNYTDFKDNENSIQSRNVIIQGANDFFNIIESISTVLDISYENTYSYIDNIVLDTVNNPSDKIVKLFSSICHSALFGGTYTKNIIENTSNFSLYTYRRSFWRAGYVNSFSGLNYMLGKIVSYIYIVYYIFGFYKLIRLFRKIKYKN